MRERLSRSAPEEIAGAVLLACALIAVALQPSAIGRLFESPYATPAPDPASATFLRTVGVETRFASDRIATRPEFDRSEVRTVPATISGDLTGRIIPLRDPCDETAAAALRNSGALVVCLSTAPRLMNPPILAAPPARVIEPSSRRAR